MSNLEQTPLEREQHDGLLQLKLNRPHKANALEAELTEALIDAVTQSSDVRLCVIRGVGRYFCAGFDLSGLDDSSDAELLWRFLCIETLLQALHHALFAVIALAHGQAVGACWRQVASADTRLRMPGWNFELALGTRRLTQTIGREAARDLLVDSKTLTAEAAASCGLVTDLVEQDEWSVLVDGLLRRATTLPPDALADMLELTNVDSRDADLAAIVKSAARPDLKQRLVAYRDRVNAAREGSAN